MQSSFPAAGQEDRTQKTGPQKDGVQRKMVRFGTLRIFLNGAGGNYAEFKEDRMKEHVNLGCGKNKEDFFIPGCRSRCDREKAGAVCPSDLYVRYFRYLEETGQIEFEEVSGGI
jgi:hypothetical protein